MLQEALSLHKKGKLDDASALYRKILARNPRNADALHLLGVIEFQRKNPSAAIELIDRAIKIEPNNAAFFSNRGLALRDLKRFEDALASYDRALALLPDYAEAFYNRGNALRSLKRFDDAVASYERALALQPDYADALFNRGNALRDLKRFDDALASYDRALAIKPDHAEALNNRGVALRELKRFNDALASFDRALAIRPGYAEAFNSRGNALSDLKRFDDALASYDRALALLPDYAEALNNRGVVLGALKRFDDALASFDRALAFRPDHADAFNSRGNILSHLKRFDEALTSYDRALEMRPDYPDALNSRGVALVALKRFDEALASFDRALAIKPDHADTFNSRGNVLSRLSRFEEALTSYDRALAIRPDYPEALNNRGVALAALKRLDEALASYDRALAFRPDYAEALNNRGVALGDLKRFDEALASFDRALMIKPDYAESFNNRGVVLRDLKHLDDALASYDHALALLPDYADALHNRGMTRLLGGHYREGWADYEWRWKGGDSPIPPPKIHAREWQGESLEGRSILVFAEQGLGDVIQFARYLPLLLQRGARVSFFGPAKLMRLLRPLSTQIAFISSLEAQNSFDFKCALMSLPLRFDTDLKSIPNQVPYLKAEEDLAARWKQIIGEAGFKIGIAWQGNPQGKADRGRSFPLSALVPLSRLPGVRLISLQTHHGLDQLTNLPAGAKVETLGEGFDNGPDAFVDTAAIMSHLDLIITSDTSIAHLAGALARPTWVALKYVPDWRWLLDREDSPWYPAARLFRQKTAGDWTSVFSAIEQEIRTLLGIGGAAPAFGVSINVPPNTKAQVSPRVAAEGPSAQQAFADIYSHATWGKNSKGAGTSGSGSTIPSTLIYRTFLQQFLKNNKIRSVVDAGCGDWEFSRTLDWSGIDYKGYDIVEAVIALDEQQFARENIQFFAGNFLELDLPPADLLICKHVLQHLPTRNVQAFLTQVTKYKHVLLTNSVDERTMSAPNLDVVVGSYRPLDPTAPPFNLRGGKVLTYWDGYHMHQVVHVYGRAEPHG